MRRLPTKGYWGGGGLRPPRGAGAGDASRPAAARFAATNDAAKAANFCGDTVYIAALLDALGFDDEATMTMTNKIKDVELVWTLGAMLAQSSALASGASGSHFGALSWLALAATLAGLWYFCLGPGSRPSGPPRLYNRPPP